MGVKELKLETAADAQNWKSYIDAEVRARDSWNNKWGWILDEYRQMSKELQELRAKRPAIRKVPQIRDSRTVLPFPVTTTQDIGWLSGKRDFQLEIYGPYPYTRNSKPPLEPPQQSTRTD
ncbi:hypothetical protein LSTR_LSTR002755 [Laodelphax striatellus]|uniref:Uncharacterized protein n=1 Tax=Laodelphax striatellus TaxID=195883 RepID=A0A482X5W6_LAOST|nr:hypothetical protein LSTR_LSTR002755 [Laodelphax striatellus]